MAVVPLGSEARGEVLEILEDRYEVHSTIIASQLLEAQWHAYIGESTIADSILDRMVHNAYKVKLEGESIRKLRHQGGDAPKKNATGEDRS